MIEPISLRTSIDSINAQRSPFALKLPETESLKLPRPHEALSVVFQPPSGSPTPTLTACEVTHLGQAHSVPGKAHPAFVDCVVASQMEIVQYLRKNKDTAIVLEGLTENMTPALFKELAAKDMSMPHAAKLIFPKGIPDNVKDLSPLQREFLYEVGAPTAMWYLGEVAQINRAIAPEESKKIDAEIKKVGEDRYGPNFGIAVQFDKELKALIFDKREAAAFAEVEALRKDGAKKVTLIFGAAHSFGRFGSAANAIEVKSVSTVSDALLSGEGTGSGPLAQIRDDSKPRPFSAFKGNYSEALVHYGNLKPETPEVRAEIVRHETDVLKHVEAKGVRLQAWEWQHLVTPELKIEGLKQLDPKSVGDWTFPWKSFEKILSTDPRLKLAGDEWMKVNRPAR